MPKTRLSPDDWANAALEAMADGGVAAVAVEALAPRVGASKGSFYWHFQDRGALLEAALHLWETTRTDAIIAVLDETDDPMERLRRLFGIAFGDRHAGRIEAAMTAQPAHPRVAPVLQRVTERRIGFLTQAFTDLGFTPAEARTRALITYNAYLGFFAVAQGHPKAVPEPGAGLTTYVETLLEILTRR
jgi:AcrR family transcriptional regulator